MQLDAWRCPRCNGMLARVKLAPGAVVEIRCHTCKTMSLLDATGETLKLRTERALAPASKLC